uniref:Glycosyl transferase family 25 domain-containing protein n=1 Tax=viral metagenome TaxID=1070528 RepID=A0A6C0BBG3_9ZZZZ
MNHILDIKHAFYINLEARVDRKYHVEQQFSILQLPINRFNAIRLPNGAIGCSMSHLKCLQIAKENGWSHVLVCEDDIKFLDPAVFQRQLNGFLEKNHDWDVVLLAGNNMPPYETNDSYSVKVRQCQTTTGYIVKAHYYDKLIKNIKDGIQQLMREPHRHTFFAIDKYWFHLQQEDNWFLIIPLTVVQRVDYSDIEKRMTNYTRAMTDLDKDFLMNQIKNARKLAI